MKRNHRVWAIAVAVLLGFFAFFAFSNAASAEVQHKFVPHEESLDWYKDQGTLDNIWPQTLTPTTCGIHQHDEYWIDSYILQVKYDEMVKGATLSGPAQDAPFHPKGTVTLLTDCAPVETATPTPTPTDTPTVPVTTPPPADIRVDLLPVTQTCDSYTVPALPAGLKYTLNADGTRPVAGTFPLAPGQVVSIQEHSIAGYIPVEAAYTVTGEKCESSTPTPSPTDTPTITPTPTNTATTPVITPTETTTPAISSVTPTPTATAVVTGAKNTGTAAPTIASSDSKLAYTGSNPLPWITAGAIALLFGLFLIFRASRRTEENNEQ